MYITLHSDVKWFFFFLFLFYFFLLILDSDYSPAGFSFQPPLPPYCSPPPMPRGTPPSTPQNFIPRPPPTPTPPPLPKGTPPPTPNRGSPSLHSRASLKAQGNDGMDEDTLTLEELEEQQRLIWAALENAESTNSESDVNIPPDAFLEAAGHAPDNSIPKDNILLNEKVTDITVAENPAKPSGTAVGLEVTEDGEAEEAACAPSPFKSNVPDRSKFAEGITPFEYDNMSEATGTYLRIRDVLKNSPRNQQKKE